MPRVRCSPASRARRKKIMKAAKGYVGGRSRTLKQAKETSKELFVMHIGIEKFGRENLGACGFQE